MTETAVSERRKYEAVWTNPDYRKVSPGEKGVEFALEIMPWGPGRLVFDLGCGTGRASWALMQRGVSVVSVDCADNAVDPNLIDVLSFQRHDLTRPFEFAAKPDGIHGFCTDVLEHIPPHHIDDVLRNIASLCDAAFLGIAHFPDSWGGEKLHLIVEPPEWWEAKLNQHFHIVERLTGFNIRRDDLNSYWKVDNAVNGGG